MGGIHHQDFARSQAKKGRVELINLGQKAATQRVSRHGRGRPISRRTLRLAVEINYPLIGQIDNAIKAGNQAFPEALRAIDWEADWTWKPTAHPHNRDRFVQRRTNKRRRGDDRCRGIIGQIT